MKKPFKILLLVLLVLVLVVLGYVIYVFASYDRIEDNLGAGCSDSTGITAANRANTDWQDAFTHFMEHRLRCLHRRL